MSFVGHGWRSGTASDTTGGTAATATVSGVAPTTDARKKIITLTVTGTNFVSGSVIYANYAPVATTFVNATTLRCDKFNTTPDNGLAGSIPIGVRNPGEALSPTVNFAAT